MNMKNVFYGVGFLLLLGIVLTAENSRTVQLKKFVDQELEKILDPLAVTLEK